jgi:hypothetical protein
MKTLDDWWSEAAEVLGVETTVEPGLLLDLARDVAHGVMRPAAPLAAYLAGVAIAGGARPADVAATLSRLAEGWPSE